MAEENQNISHGNYQPAAHEKPAETKEPAAGGGVFDYLRKKKEEYLPAAAAPAPVTTNDEPEVKSRGMFDFFKAKTTEGEENKETAAEEKQNSHGYQQPADRVTTTQDDESENKDQGSLDFSGSPGIPQGEKRGIFGSSGENKEEEEEEVIPTSDHGYRQPDPRATTDEEESEIKGRGMLGSSWENKEEEVIPTTDHGYRQPAARATTDEEEESEIKDRGIPDSDFSGNRGNPDFSREKKEEEEVVPTTDHGYRQPAARATDEEESEIKGRGIRDSDFTEDRGIPDFSGEKKEEEVVPTTDHGYRQPAAPTDEEESEIKGRGIPDSDFSGNRGNPDFSRVKKEEEEEVVPTTDHGYRQPAARATTDEEESEIKDRGITDSDFSGNRGGNPDFSREKKEEEIKGRETRDSDFSGNRGILGFPEEKKEEEVVPTTDHGYRKPTAPTTTDEEESEIKGRGILDSDFSGNRGIPQGEKRGMHGSTDQDDESEIKDRGMFDFSGKNKEEDQEKVVPEETRGYQPAAPTTQDESEIKDRGMFDFSGKNKEEDQEKVVPEETRGYQPAAPTTQDESEIKDRGLLDFLGKKKEHEKEENREMTEEQIPISHGNYQPAAPATHGESEIKDRGMFDFLGKKKKEEEEVVPTTTIYDDVEKEDEKKQHSSLLEKLKGSNNANSSSDEEVEENGEKIRRKKKKGLKEKIHEKVSGDNKVEEEPEKKINYFHEEKCDDETHAHPEQKKGLIEKIKGKLHKKSSEDQGTTQSFGAPAAPAGHPVSIDHHEYSSPTEAAQHDGEETKEKKGFLEKIKDKFPGHHKSASNEEKKDTPTNY